MRVAERKESSLFSSNESPPAVAASSGSIPQMDRDDSAGANEVLLEQMNLGLSRNSLSYKSYVLNNSFHIRVFVIHEIKADKQLYLTDVAVTNESYVHI